MSALKKAAQEKMQQREWKAKLSLTFACKNEKTVMTERKHFGPLVVQRPFYPEANVCHVYLIHPPGGVVGGDKLMIDINLQEFSHVLITTPSAGKFYRSGSLTGTQQQYLMIEENSLLEWFPQETIFFDGCNSKLETEIRLAGNAMFCGWEISCLGRPAADEQYENGSIASRFKLYRDSRAIFLENNAIEGGDALLTASCGFNRHSVFATMLATAMDKKICDELQSVWHQRKKKNISISLIGDVLVCRYLGDSAEQAKKYFTEIWSVIRSKQIKRKICVPRIWYT